MRNKELIAGAKKIAEALKSPGGQIALARVALRHIAWFDLAQEHGLSWDQMIAVLHAAGAAQSDGLPFSRGHLSSAVWRARKKTAGGATAHGGKASPSRGERQALTGRADFHGLKGSGPKAPAQPDKTDANVGDRPATNMSSGGEAERSALEFMRRTAARRSGRAK